METKNEKIKYFLYARKSSESEDRQVASIEAQVTELQKIAEKENLEIVEIFQESKSAKAPNKRPVFSDMIQRVYSGKANGILCWKLDRLARNPVDGGTVNWMLQNGIVQQIKAFDREYNQHDNVLMMSVEFGMANQFIRDLSANTKRGMKAKAEKGWMPKKPAIGYLSEKYKPKGEKGIVPDPDRFNKVRRLWDILLERKLNIDEIHTLAIKEVGLMGFSGRPVARSTVYSIFKNPFYYGKFYWSGEWYQGLHKPMITKEEFDLAQQIISRRGKLNRKKHFFPFTGFIRCGECGAMITAEKKVKIQKNGNVHFYTYYRCTKRKSVKCSQPSIRERDLLKQAKNRVKQIDIPSEFKEWVVDVLKSEHLKESANKENTRKKYQKEYSVCSKKLINLTDLRISGDIDQNTFREHKETLLEEKARLQELINDNEKNLDSWINIAEKKLVIAETAKEKFENGGPEKQREVLENIGIDFILKDRVFDFNLEDVFESVRTASKRVRVLDSRFAPLKNGFTETQYTEMYGSDLLLGPYPDLNRN